MLIKPIPFSPIKHTTLISEAIELYQNISLPFIPIINDHGQFLGVFDKQSLINLLFLGINHNDTVDKIINYNFPTIKQTEISRLLDEKSNSYIIVLNSEDQIKGLINPYEDNDFLSLLNIPFFDKFLDSISDGVLICDRNLIVKKVNKAYTQLTGVPAEEIEGFEVNKVRKGSRISEAVHSGKTMKNIYRKEGNTEYFVDLYPLQLKDNVIGGIVLAKDITEIQYLTKKANEWENKFSKLKSNVNAHHRANKTFDHIITRNDKMRECIEIGKKVASYDSNIIIRGESGTGKDLFAQAIHNCSYRNMQPFVAINCAAIAPTLVLSELFGYEDGAFTGASKGGKMGLFELAHKGTLFLDEIGDMDLELQSKLLRVLETGEITRVGGSNTIQVNVRIISATNVNLEESVANNKFRSDLYFRLNVVPITLPPLRERMEDIPYLIDSILNGLSINLKRKLSIAPEVLEILLKYHWPGNIRELQNVIAFAANITEQNIITLEYIPQKIKNYRDNSNIIIDRSINLTGKPLDSLNEVKIESERDQIIFALREFGTNLHGKKTAAKMLGISLATLYNKINQYNIKNSI